jgi:hypothetical protein
VKVLVFCESCTNSSWFDSTIVAGSSICCAFPKDGKAEPEGYKLKLFWPA